MVGRTTNISIVLSAEVQCTTSYWSPLYEYVRRKGHDEYDAADLTQEFFASLIARNDFAGLDPSQGRFRAFLLAAMNHFLAKEWRKANALKRGGGQPVVSFERMAEHGDTGLADNLLPEQAYDRRWAETVLQRAAQRVEAEFIAQGRELLFRRLNVFLSAPPETDEYDAAAKQLEMTKAAVAKVVERMRRRYRDLVRDEIAQTVSSASDLDDELRYLVELLTR